MNLLEFIFLQTNSLSSPSTEIDTWTYIKGKVSDIGDHLVDFVPKVVGATAVLIIGFWLIKRIIKVLVKKLDNSSLNAELKPFLKGTVSISLKIMVLLIAAGILGVETSSFAALLAAVGFSIGLAFQGSLGHLASGVLIFIFRPFKVGDIVEIHEKLGEITEIEILNTHIKTFDNKDVIIPNGMAISDVVTNLSNHDYIRVELQIPLGYGSSFPEVKTIIEDTLSKTEKVLTDPLPFVGINNFDTHFIVLDVFAFCLVQDYWDVYYASYQNIKKALSENGIKMSYSEGVELGEIGG